MLLNNPLSLTPVVYLPKYRPFIKEECKADPTRDYKSLFIERSTGIMDWKTESPRSRKID